MTVGSDNPFPSVLFAEHVDPSNPGAGTQRLFVDTDHILKLIDSAGTVVTFAGGFADPMTTRGDVIVRNASNVTARLAIGSSGKVLSSDGTDVSWQTPASAGAMATDVLWDAAGDLAQGTGANTGAKLAIGTAGQFLKVNAGATAAEWQTATRIEYTLSGDVTMTTATTFYDGPSGTPAAGTYDVDGYVNVITNTANEDGIVCRLLNGSTVVDERSIYIGGNSSGGPPGGGGVLSARVTMNGSDTLKITASSYSRNGSVMKRDPAALSSALHRATMIVAVRVA